MSMSVSCHGCGLEYAGALGLSGMFPTAGNLRPGPLPPAAHRGAALPPSGERAAGVGAATDLETIDAFLDRGRFSPYFRTHFVTPLIACVWSCGPDVAGRYPARYLFEFLSNHGMLSVTGSPKWRTVVGGSQRYVEQAAKNLSGVRTATPVRGITRTSSVSTSATTPMTSRRSTLRWWRRTGPGAPAADRSDQDARSCSAPSSTPLTRPCCTTTPRAATGPSRPGVLELPDARVRRHRRRGRGQLRPQPAPAARHAGRVPGDAQRPGHHPRRSRARADGLRAPDLHPRLGRRTAPAARAQRRSPRVRRRLPGWGFHEDGCRSGVRAAESLGVTW